MQNPKLCGFYRFLNEYLDLIEKVVIINCEEIEELEEGSEDSGNANHEGKKDVEILMWKMNCFIVVVIIVVFAVVVRSVVMT